MVNVLKDIKIEINYICKRGRNINMQYECYKENLINENKALRELHPIDRLMMYRNLTNKEMMDRDRCELSQMVYRKLDWFNLDNKRLEPDTFFSSAYYYLKKMCLKFDFEEKQEDLFYIKDFKRYVEEQKENYYTISNLKAQFLRKKWYCLSTTKEHYKKIFNNIDVLNYVESSHKIGAFHIIPYGFGFNPKCKWLLDDGIRSLRFIEDNWENIKNYYDNITFKQYKKKYCLEKAYCNGLLKRELEIDFDKPWEDIFSILKKMTQFIDQRTEVIISKLKDRDNEKNIFI